jgi:hypothetical protein
MTGWKRVLAWASTIAGGLALVGLGVVFVVVGLDTADRLASVIGAFAALVGLGLSGYGVVLARRTAPVSGPGPQRVAGVDTGGGVDVVDGVAGNVRLGVAAPSVPAGPPAVTPPTAGEQSVTDVRATGSVRVVRGVGGDVDIAP